MGVYVSRSRATVGRSCTSTPPPQAVVSVSLSLAGRSGGRCPMPDVKAPLPQQHPHWYRIHVTECVLCGRTTEDRERIYGSPPKGSHYEHRQMACGDHF